MALVVYFSDTKFLFKVEAEQNAQVSKCAPRYVKTADASIILYCSAVASNTTVEAHLES
jgi:hypothetical protein